MYLSGLYFLLNVIFIDYLLPNIIALFVMTLSQLFSCSAPQWKQRESRYYQG
jgi:hypothetical protein